LRGGRILQAANEIRGEDRFWGGGMFPWNGIAYLRAAFTPEILKKAVRGTLDRRRVAGYLKLSLIAPDFAASIGIEQRFERMREIFPAGWIRDYASERCQVIRPSVTAGRERYERLAAANAVEARDPFLDKRLVEYCALLPGRLRMRDGWPKTVLRDVMAGRLPAEVLWARGKPHLGWMFNAAVTREAIRRNMLSLQGLQDDLAGYVDSAPLAQAWHTFQSGSNTEPLHSAHALSIWLRENVHRPVVLDRGIG
jgi:asparagine synthase (glutamine-hydrolysing)